MSHPSVTEPIRKMCPSKREHPGHKWWSRQHKMFFLCGGRKPKAANA